MIRHSRARAIAMHRRGVGVPVDAIVDGELRRDGISVGAVQSASRSKAQRLRRGSNKRHIRWAKSPSTRNGCVRRSIGRRDRLACAVLVMSDREGFTLVISDPTKFGGDGATYPEGFHVGLGT
jgi:hypothetical protein